MHGRILRVTLFLILAALALAAQQVGAQHARAAAPSTARTASSAPLSGINIGGPRGDTTQAEVSKAIAAAAALHAQIVRVEVSWSLLEPLAAGQTDAAALADIDRVVNDAAAAGIHVLMVVDSTPCWASSAPASVLRRCNPRRPGAASSWPPSNPSDFGSFTAMLASRYGSKLAAIEIWNEPDYLGEDYFAGPNKAQRYTALVRTAYTAIKQANPLVPVLAGSLVGSNGVFLRALYAAGIKGYYDGLAVHFYNLTLAALRSIRAVQLANGDPSPLWLDEFGWSSCWPHGRLQDEQPCVTARIQAANLADLVHSLASTSYVHAIAPFKLEDSPHEEFGVLTEAGVRKRAFSSLAHAFAAPFGRARATRLALRRRGGHVFAEGSGPVGDYLQLEVSRTGGPRYRALFTLDRNDRYRIKLPPALGSSALHARVFQLWSGPRRAAHASL
jgi:polysaccharide biosynthesis protein PslG